MDAIEDSEPESFLDLINGMDAVDFWFTLVVFSVCIVPILVALLLFV